MPPRSIPPTLRTTTHTAAVAVAPPSIRCAERMRQLILRAAPSALHTIGDVLRFAVQQNFSDEQVIRQLAHGLGVEMHGWPKDPVARRRLRVERFYQFNNVPIDTRRIEAALASSHTEDELIQALYKKYQRNEIGESLDPDIALGESLLHLFACTNPAMMAKVHSFVVEQGQSGLTHGDYLEEVCNALGVCTDGWPLDPDERLRKRLESFYRLNDPKKMDRVDILMRREFSDEEIFSALYDKYGRDELGQPVQNERLLREQLIRLLQPTQAQSKVEELLQYKKDRRLTDVELVHAVRKMLKVGDDGLPLDPIERLRTRVRMYFRANSSLKPPTTDYAAAPGSSDAHEEQQQQPPKFSAVHRRQPPHPRYKPDPPLLTQDELDELHASNDVLDALLQDELLRIRLHRNDRSSDGTEGQGIGTASSAGGAPGGGSEKHGGGNSPLLSRLKRRVSNFFVAKRNKSVGGEGGGGDVEKLLTAGDGLSAPSNGLLSSVTLDEEEAILARLCVRFQRNEVGEVLLPAVERERIRLDLIKYLERFIVAGSDVVAVASDIAQLHLSEENMWELARHQYGGLEEHKAHAAFRDHLTAMLQRCAPHDLHKVPMLMLCMFEDNLSHDEVIRTVERKYGVDADGWPVGDPLARRRTQLSMLFRCHDPQKLPLIESLYLKLPLEGNDDRLYQRLCASYGADELGRPVARDVGGGGAEDRPRDEEGDDDEHATAGAFGSNSAVNSKDAQHLFSATMMTSTSMSSTSGGGRTPGGLSGNSPLRTSAECEGAAQPWAQQNSLGGDGPPPSMLWQQHNPHVGVDHSSSGHYVGNQQQHAPSAKTTTAAPTTSRPAERRFHRQSPAADTFLARQGAGPVGGSFYGPLRALRARDQWNGDAAAADVAAVIGEDFLRALQEKYGADAPACQNAHDGGQQRAVEATAAPQHRRFTATATRGIDPAHAAQGSPPSPLPQSAQFEFRSRVTSRYNAVFENPVERMRRDAQTTLDLVRTDAKRNSIQRSNGKRSVLDRSITAHDALGAGQQGQGSQHQLLSIDWSLYLPQESAARAAAAPRRQYADGGPHNVGDASATARSKLQWVDETSGV